MVVNLATFLSVNIEKGLSLYQLPRKNKVVVMYLSFFIEESTVFFCKYRHMETNSNCA